MRALQLTAGVVATLLVLVVGTWVLSALDADEGPSGDEAAMACRQAVEDQLKSPGSAQWADETARPVGSKEWRVTGVVDSENSFGASLRSSYRCTAHSDGGDEWTTTDVLVLPN